MKKTVLAILLAACAHEHVNQSRVFVKTLNPDAEIIGDNSVFVLEETKLSLCLPKPKGHGTICLPMGDVAPQKSVEAPQESKKSVEAPPQSHPYGDGNTKPGVEPPKVEEKKEAPKPKKEEPKKP